MNELPVKHPEGWYGLPCWNGLDFDQQIRLIEVGTLGFGWQPRGLCREPAEIEITTRWDTAPGPRFYCRRCAVQYLTSMLSHNDDER